MEAKDLEPESNSGNKRDQLDSSDRADAEPSIFRAVREATNDLNHLAFLTRLFAIAGMIATMMNVAMFAALLPILRTLRAPLTYLYLEAVLSASALIFLGLQELYRKKGDGYFQELSDMIQVFFGVITDNNRGYGDFSVVQRGRVAARNFASAAYMPFVPGPLGPALYAGINLVILAIWVTFFILIVGYGGPQSTVVSAW